MQYYVEIMLIVADKLFPILFVVKMKQSKGIIREAMGMGRFDG